MNQIEIPSSSGSKRNAPGRTPDGESFRKGGDVDYSVYITN